MVRIILFGGGDGGGLIVGPNGVRPIPPFDAAIRLQLQGLSALLQGNNGSSPARREMALLTTKVSNLLIAELERTIGPLEGDHSFVYQNEDGGFTCGSTGKPPIPFPWPPSSAPGLDALLASGLMERDLVDFLQAAAERKLPFTKALENPEEAARELKVPLSKQTVEDLRQVAPSNLAKLQDPVHREVVGFFHKVADDGRFIESWVTRPYDVAQQLNVKLSDAAIDRILAGGAAVTGRHGSAVAVGVVAHIVIHIVVNIVVQIATARAPLSIRDRSAVKKF